MSKKVRQFVCAILVMANFLTSNTVLLADDFIDNTEPTETVAADGSAADKNTDSSDNAEDSEASMSSSSPESSDPAPALAQTRDSEMSDESDVNEPSDETMTDMESSGSSESSESEPVPAEALESHATEKDSEKLTKTVLDSEGQTYTVTATYGSDTGIPEDCELVVKEIISGSDFNEYYDKTMEVMGDQNVGYVRFFDISIVKDGVEYEPAEGTTVNVKIQLEDSLGQDVSVVHFADDAEPEVVEDLNVRNNDGTTITFEADGFSAYAIVKTDLTPADFDWVVPKTLDEIASLGPDGFYITSEGVDVTAGYFMTDELIHNVTSNPDRDGINCTANQYPDEIPDDAVKYYFNRVEGTTDKFTIYTTISGVNNYLKMTQVTKGDKTSGRQSLSFVTDASEATEFTLEKYGTYNSFRVHVGENYWVRNRNTPGAGTIVGYKNRTDPTLFPIKLVRPAESVNVDPYGLNNKSLGLMYYDTGLSGKGMTDKSSTAGILDTLTMPVLTQRDNHDDKLFVPNDTDLTLWKINWVEEDKYTFSTKKDGSTKYLNITSSGLECSDTPQEIQVIPGTGTNHGKISLINGNNVLTYSGDIDSGFGVNGTNANKFRWLNFVDLAELTSDYVLTYAAKKISVSDERLTSGTKVIVYTRVWNESKKRYDFYAINHEGELVQCFEEGDEIQWIGDRINTLLWDFTIYYEKGKPHTKENENGYYELYNEYSEKFITPTAGGTIALADDKIGINMVGRRDGNYYSTIVAWDDDHYAYAGIRTDDGKIISYPVLNDMPSDESKDFYFATITDLKVTDQLTEVDTVNNDDYGIKMKMINFPVSGSDWAHGVQSEFLGSSEGGARLYPVKGLLSANLGSDGYPTNRSGQSLKNLYSGDGLKDANHLFIESTHKSTGYFEYDSTQNFAHFDEDTGNFVVYQELGTADHDNRLSLQHGVFFPYNNIEAGNYSDHLNLYTASQTPLPETDPRKYETMYETGTPDYNFGMELETSFVQTPDGRDDWDHDIIYEFCGDDDFWLYVDGKLVIDLGGVHSAISGTINFCTGEVFVQGNPNINTTLYDIFKKNYKDQGHTEAEAIEYLDTIFKVNSEGKHVFKDYTSHTMRIFYMERGQGSSNLHMRFNQSSVKPNTVILSKELANVDETESFYASFPFQIWYQLIEGDPYTTLSNHDALINVRYKGTDREVAFSPSYTVEGCTYENVYFLEAGQACEINVPDGAIKYYIVECGVDPNVYSEVTANDDVITGTVPVNKDASYDGRLDFGIDPAKVDDRTSVEYVNSVNPDALRTVSFKKILWDENGVGHTELHNDPTRFNFRLSFGTEHDDDDHLTLANMYTYHVKDEDGNYCKWDYDTKDFVKLRDGATDYSSLTLAEKKSVSFTTSMYGAISKIPAFYTVEIRQVLAETRFEVAERYSEIPDGYSRIKYTLYDDKNDPEGVDYTNRAIGEVDYGKDPLVEVHNVKGYAIRIYKEWSDEKFMSDRDSTYFAAYIGNELLTDSVYELPYYDDTLYWYFENLRPGTTLEDYHIYEVAISDPVVDADGIVTSWSSISPVLDGQDITLNGTLGGEPTAQPVTYTASYSSTYSNNNMRVDTITNDRPGITIYKEDMHDHKMANAYFNLRDDHGNLIGTFVSDENGKVTVAYLRKNVDYTLEETKSPQGYHGLDNPLTLRLNNDGTVTVIAASDIDNRRIEVDNRDIENPTVTVKNIKYDFTITKRDKITHDPIQGVKFELHKQRTVGGVTVVDFHPIPGYENLLTDANGIVPRIDSSLPAGTYELREVETPATHHSLNYYVMFTVTDTGDIKINSVHPEIILDVEEGETELGEKRLYYTLYIDNIPISDDFTITKEVRGNLGNKMDEFPVTVTFASATGQAFVGTFYTETNGGEPVEHTLTASDLGKYTFNIRHGDSVVFTGLDPETRFVVTENYGDYMPSTYINNVLNSNTGTATGIISEQRLVRFVNTREGIIPTGLEASFNASVSLIGALCAGLIFRLCYKAKRRREEY